MVCRALLEKQQASNLVCWHENDLQMLKSVKKSIVGKKSAPHFGASGQYFSFSMNALYNIDHKNSSVGLYGSKKGKDYYLSFIEEKLSMVWNR